MKIDLVLNEKEFALNAIEASDFGGDKYWTINRVARYYRSCTQTDEEAVRKTEEFMIRCDRHINVLQYRSMIEDCVKQFKKRKLICIESVPITQNELDLIATLDSMQSRMVLFAMLCIAKYWNAINPDNNSWVNRSYSDLFRTANFHGGEDRRSKVMRELFDSGMAQYSNRATSENTRVTIADDTSEAVVHIVDMRNLGNQYRMIVGEPYFVCQSCGMVVRKKSNSQRYCSSCAKSEYLRQQRVIYWQNKQK